MLAITIDSHSQHRSHFICNQSTPRPSPTRPSRARHAHVGHVMRIVLPGWLWAGEGEEGEQPGQTERAEVMLASLALRLLLARLPRHCSTCGLTFMFFSKHLRSLSLSLSLCLPPHYDIYCHFSCHLQSKCGKWQNNQH